jgi:hypothetical protein
MNPVTDGDLKHENSLRGRLAARRVALREERTFDLPVPGYEKEIIARYQPLDYIVLRRIGDRQESEPDKFQREVNTAADTLANACVGLYEVGEDGKAGASLNARWSTSAAKDLFGVPELELPQGSGARQALFAIFASDTSVVLHYSDYSELASDVSRQIDEDVAGESVSSTEA